MHRQCYFASVNARFLLLLLVASAMPLFAATVDAPTTAVATGLQRDVVFSDYSPLSSSMELARRLLSPLNAMRVSQELARSGQPARE